MGRELSKHEYDASSLVVRVRGRGYKLRTKVNLRGFGEVPMLSAGTMADRADHDDDSR